jgi:serine/threonine protein kinase
MALNRSAKLGSYEVQSPLGAGGMGVVYLAKQSNLGRQVAIKVLASEATSDPERVRRFEQEACPASALNHPNIISIYDVGRENTTAYIAMEFVDGRTLRALLESGPLTIKKTLQIAVQIADGLAKAYAAGIVHRDLMPGQCPFEEEQIPHSCQDRLWKLQLQRIDLPVAHVAHDDR